jgi:hypothetical protein
MALKQSYRLGDELTDQPGTATCVTNAATLNKRAGVITSESLATAAGASQALTITCNQVAATDLIFIDMNGGTNTTGSLEMKVVPGAGSFVITLTNRHASAAFNGTFKIAYQIVKV